MRTRPALLCLLSLLLCALASPRPALAAPKQPSPLPDVEELVAGAMADAQIPGLAVALIRRGEVVLTRGFGVRDLRGRRPVTARTVFALGSISKPVAATAIAALVDEGKLDLDRPVRDLLPEFRLHDEWATAHLALRDLLSHRSGLPGHDALWYFTSFSRPELVRRLRHLEPSSEPRASYQYNSLLFMTAGHAAAQHVGLSYEELARTRLLVPLGMKRTSFSIADMQKEDHALPHRRVNGAALQIPFLNIDVMAPSGGVNASVEDLIPFLLLHLRGGKHGAKQLFAEKTLLELQKPHVPIHGKPRYPEIRDRAAGLGFEVATYRDRRLLSHTGWVDGYKGLALLVPEEQSGVLVLCNLENTPVVNSLAYALLDRLLGLPELPWRERGREQLRKQDEEDRTAHENKLPQKPGTRPSRPLTEYAGEYEHPGYGPLRVTLSSDGPQPALSLTYGRTTAPLRHLHYDVFHRAPAPFDPMGPVTVSFIGGVDGGIQALAVPLEPRLPDRVFVRRAAP